MHSRLQLKQHWTRQLGRAGGLQRLWAGLRPSSQHQRLFKCVWKRSCIAPTTSAVKELTATAAAIVPDGIPATSQQLRLASPAPTTTTSIGLNNLATTFAASIGTATCQSAPTARQPPAATATCQSASAARKCPTATCPYPTATTTCQSTLSPAAPQSTTATWDPLVTTLTAPTTASESPT